MMDRSLGFYGSNGITGGSIPFATGLALAAKMQGSDRVTACFFGDGASNQGTFHESLNMAALWQLPVVYIVENNGYAMSTATSDGVSCDQVVARAAGYGMRGVWVDGNDFFAVRDTVAAAAEQARSGGGPTLVECQTYRLSGHSRGDPRVYRSREEEAEAWQQDPLVRMECCLSEYEGLGDADFAEVRLECQDLIDEAIEFSEESEFPVVDGLTDLFAE